MTIRSDAGRVTLFEPPAWNPDAVAQLPQLKWLRPRSSEAAPSTKRRIALTDARFRVFERAPGAAVPTLKETVAALRNDQVEWYVTWTEESSARRPSLRNCSCLVQIGSPAFLLSIHDDEEVYPDFNFSRQTVIPPAFRSADATASLLPVLEDPQRVLIAHLLLGRLYPQPTLMTQYEAEVIDGVYPVDGLNLKVAEGTPLIDQKDWKAWDGVVSIDPTQLPRMRDQWHRRLDVAKASAPWWAITATLALLPLVWLAAFAGRALRRRQRQSRGLCRACGYDLRASAGRCPECGHATVQGTVNGEMGSSLVSSQ